MLLLFFFSFDQADFVCQILYLGLHFHPELRFLPGRSMKHLNTEIYINQINNIILVLFEHTSWCSHVSTIFKKKKKPPRLQKCILNVSYDYKLNKYLVLNVVFRCTLMTYTNNASGESIYLLFIIHLFIYFIYKSGTARRNPLLFAGCWKTAKETSMSGIGLISQRQHQFTASGSLCCHLARCVFLLLFAVIQGRLFPTSYW